MTPTFPILFAVALLSEPPVAADEAAPRPVVLQRHSIEAFTRPLREAATSLPLLPLRGPDVEWEDEPSGETRIRLDGDSLVDLLRSTIEPDLWDSAEAVAIDVHDGTLAIRAPADTQARIAELLATLERDLLPSEWLELRVLPGGVAAAGGGPLVVDRATADRRLAQSGALRTHRTRLQDSITVGATVGEPRECVSSWEHEIAKQSSAGHPRVLRWLDGLRFCARAARLDGGVLLHLALCHADAVAPDALVDPSAVATTALSSSVHHASLIGRIEQPRAGFVSFAGSVFLAEGKAVWIPVTVRTAFGPVECTLELRCELGASRPLASVGPIRSAEDGELRLALHRPGARAIGSIELYDLVRESTYADPFDSALRYEGAVAQLAGDPGLSLEEQLGGVPEVARALEEGGRCAVMTYGPDYLTTLLPSAVSDVAQAQIAAFAAESAGATLRGRIEVAGQPRAEFALPLRIGSPAALWSGVQSTRIVDWDVDVAEGAASAHPRVRTFLDGFALRFTPALDSQRNLRVGVHGLVQLLEAPPSLVPLGDAAQMVVQRLRAAAATFDEEVVVTARGGSDTLGGDVALVLEIGPLER